MRDPLLFLEDIIKSLSKINRYIEGMEYSDIAKDEKTVDALTTRDRLSRKLPHCWRNDDYGARLYLWPVL